MDTRFLELSDQLLRGHYDEDNTVIAFSYFINKFTLETQHLQLALLFEAKIQWGSSKEKTVCVTLLRHLAWNPNFLIRFIKVAFHASKKSINAIDRTSYSQEVLQFLRRALVSFRQLPQEPAVFTERLIDDTFPVPELPMNGILSSQHNSASPAIDKDVAVFFTFLAHALKGQLAVNSEPQHTTLPPELSTFFPFPQFPPETPRQNRQFLFSLSLGLSLLSSTDLNPYVEELSLGVTCAYVNAELSEKERLYSRRSLDDLRLMSGPYQYVRGCIRALSDLHLQRLPVKMPYEIPSLAGKPSAALDVLMTFPLERVKMVLSPSSPADPLDAPLLVNFLELILYFPHTSTLGQFLVEVLLTLFQRDFRPDTTITPSTGSYLLYTVTQLLSQLFASPNTTVGSDSSLQGFSARVPGEGLLGGDVFSPTFAHSYRTDEERVCAVWQSLSSVLSFMATANPINFMQELKICGLLLERFVAHVSPFPTTLQTSWPSQHTDPGRRRCEICSKFSLTAPYDPPSGHCLLYDLHAPPFAPIVDHFCDDLLCLGTMLYHHPLLQQNPSLSSSSSPPPYPFLSYPTVFRTDTAQFPRTAPSSSAPGAQYLGLVAALQRKGYRVEALPHRVDERLRAWVLFVQGLNSLPAGFSLPPSSPRQNVAKKIRLEELPKVTHFTGLKNTGNTCFINSTLQGLLACQCVREFLIAYLHASKDVSTPLDDGDVHRHALGYQLGSLFVSLLLTPVPAVAPAKVSSLLPPAFLDHRQHDASEFIRTLLDFLFPLPFPPSFSSLAPSSSSSSSSTSSSSTTASSFDPPSQPLFSFLPNTNALSSSLFSQPPLTGFTTLTGRGKEIASQWLKHSSKNDDHFLMNNDENSSEQEKDEGGSGPQREAAKCFQTLVCGRQVVEVVCAECHTHTRSHESFVDLGLFFPETAFETKANFTLQELVDYHLREEALLADNQYHCDCCGGLRNAGKRTRFGHLPPVLLITLHRFGYSATAGHFKLLNNVNVPDRLTLSAAENQITYELVALTVHQGQTTHCGHYYTYTKKSAVFPPPPTASHPHARPHPHADASDWVLCNDDRVKPIDRHEVPSLSPSTSPFNWPHDTASNAATPYILYYHQCFSSSHS